MPIHERPDMRDQLRVFRDREEAGSVLSALIGTGPAVPDSVFAVTVGALITGAAVAAERHLPLDLALVGRIPFPWNPEAGFGVAAFDGTVRLHAGLIGDMGLREPEIRRGERLTLERLAERMDRLRGQRPAPEFADRRVLLVDDGVASSLSMSTAIAVAKARRARSVAVAVATGYEASLERLAREVDAVYCPNVRGGWGFAVADAFEHYGAVSDAQATETLTRHRG